MLINVCICLFNFFFCSNTHFFSWNAWLVFLLRQRHHSGWHFQGTCRHTSTSSIEIFTFLFLTRSLSNSAKYVVGILLYFSFDVFMENLSRTLHSTLKYDVGKFVSVRVYENKQHRTGSVREARLGEKGIDCYFILNQA